MVPLNHIISVFVLIMNPALLGMIFYRQGKTAASIVSMHHRIDGLEERLDSSSGKMLVYH